MRILRSYLRLDSIDFHKNYQLDDTASHHFGQVLRVKTGDSIEVFDGQGNTFSARVIAVGKIVSIQLVEQLTRNQNESRLRLALIIAVGKGEKMDWIVQKATELGVNAIYPVITSRCEVRLNAERWQKKIDRWQEIAVNACEQSQRSILPTVHAIETLSTRLQSLQIGLKLVLHPGNGQQSFHNLLGDGQKPEQVTLLIGPEGGFDQNEVKLAQEKGYTPLTCGPRILRMETAVLASIAILQMMFGDI